MTVLKDLRQKLDGSHYFVGALRPKLKHPPRDTFLRNGSVSPDGKAAPRLPEQATPALPERKLVPKRPPPPPPDESRPPRSCSPHRITTVQRQPGAVVTKRGEVRLWHGRQAVAQGGYGRFFRAITPKGELRGLKEVRVSEVGTTTRRHVFQEVENMKQLGMRVYGVYETSNQTMLVETDLFAGDLAHAFAQIPRRQRSGAARHALAQQARQLGRMHAAGYIHRDVKSDNTLFNEDGRVQVADPGLAVKKTLSGRYGCGGTYASMAPEVLRLHDTRDGRYDQKVDTWSLGTVICESLVAGDWPLWQCHSAEDTLRGQQMLIDFRRSVMHHGEVDMPAVDAKSHDHTWGAYFHKMALADRAMCKFALGHMFDPNPKTRATMKQVAAAAGDVSLLHRILGHNERVEVFKRAARSDPRYRTEVDQLRRHLQSPAAKAR